MVETTPPCVARRESAVILLGAPSFFVSEDFKMNVVIKFGGTSVANLKCWQTIKAIAEKRLREGLRPVIVCSAVAKVSDLLERLIAEAQGGNYCNCLEAIKRRHIELAAELSVDAGIATPYFEDLEKLAKGISLVHEASPKIKARVMACGELLSTRLGHAYLKTEGLNTAWIDARELLRTEDQQNTNVNKHYLSALCAYDKDDALIKKISNEKAEVVITQGFIASDSSGDTVLLGRGGSDVSAAYFAAKIAAARCEIWTDVCGVFTANPRHLPSARLLKNLDYDEAQEIVSLGAKVLHPRCITPLKKHSIPIHVYALDYPDTYKTLISADAKNILQVKAVSSKLGITVISMDTIEMWQQAGFLAEIFSCFKRLGLSIDLVSTSETSVTVTLDRTANVLDKETLDKLTSDLSGFCHVNVIHMAGLVSLVGRGIRAILHKLGSALEAFEEHKIYLVSQASNDLNLTFVVDEECVEKLVHDLHAELFQIHRESELFGPTWQEIVSKKTSVSETHPEKWWARRQKELLSLAEKETPIFVYDTETINAQVGKLAVLKSVNRIFYSIKANWHPEILKTFFNKGLGFECVSQGEISHLLKLFPDIVRNRILFTPNFVSKNEYKFALDAGVHVTIDNVYPISQWPGIFKGRSLFVRIDPGEGRGHHKFVHTAGARSKFGVYPSEIENLLKLANKLDIKITGLHAHVGSNILEADTWALIAGFLLETAKKFKDVRFLDIGGGLGISEKPGQTSLDLGKVDEKLGAVLKGNSGYEIWIEPGRFLTAEAGVLLAKVTQTKQKGDYNFIGLDVGMNSLIRPALYGAHHEITNLSRVNERPSVIANIVGPICESGDVLGYSRYVAEPREGDIFLIATVGAYGRSMSSNYNLRLPPKEYIL